MNLNTNQKIYFQIRKIIDFSFDQAINMELFLAIFFGISFSFIFSYFVITNPRKTIEIFLYGLYYILLGMFWIIPPLIIFYFLKIYSLSGFFLSFIIWFVIVKNWSKIEKVFDYDLFSIFKKSKS